MSHSGRKIIHSVEKINVVFYHVSLRALNNFLYMQVAYILGGHNTFQVAPRQVIFNSVVAEIALHLKELMDWRGIEKFHFFPFLHSSQPIKKK